MDNRYYFTEQKENLVVIAGGEAQHLSKVRRAKVGDKIVAFNGDGYDYNLEITNITKDKFEAKVLTKEINKATNDTNIVVYLSMIKNDALTTAIDNLAELNVKQVKLFKSDYSVAVIDEKKLDKLNQISIQASKQCERADIMQITIINKKDIEKDCENSNTFFAYENSSNKIESFTGDFAVIIGPEGGFSESENEYFSSFAKNISLSKTILRAEVACVASVSMLKAVNDEG
ncbi:MAG: 16S rRNA (uracil(1498)-N(3))-methyltransferase [Clostridia bacterium]|nr:16S rRNA (uracil(1498)-N(3))-methyltransferase [Clostridia bacterium]